LNLLSADRLLIALGGNAIHPGHIRGTAQEQLDIAERTANALLPVLETGIELVLTHGNGPVVGKILMRQALSGDHVTPMPLEVCVAHSQGGIAYMLMQALENALRRRANPRHVACLLTQVEVDPDDPAFEHPSKPIGFFYSEEQAGKVAREFDWVMREDAGRGWRHVVASPLPQHIVNVSLIERVLTSGAVVIAGGGGGIPVQRLEDGTRRGIEAVIDKDFTSAMMANLLNIDTFLMLTEVDNVIVDFGTDKAQPLAQVSIERMQSLYDAGQFPEGSMGPKVKAALNFLEGGGRRAAIGSLEQAEAVYKGTAGTQILS
jgi:carbamate kinase